MRSYQILFFLLFSSYGMQAQIGSIFKGDEESDTVFYYALDTFNLTARSYHNYNSTRYANMVSRVYPYADTAIQTLKRLEAMQFDKKKEEKKYKKALEDSLRNSFEGTLKNLTRSQGAVMIEIIERNTGRTLYDILKEVKSGGTAFWWHSLGKMYGYDLKTPYDPLDDPSLEELIRAYEEKHKKK